MRQVQLHFACARFILLFILACSAADTLAAPPLVTTKLVFTTQPVNGTAGQVLPAVQVSAESATGKVVTTDNTTQVKLTLSSNTLNGTLTQTVVKGVATFSNLSINTVATGYTLTAATPTLQVPPVTSATSGAFDIVPAAPAKLVFVQEPTNVAAGEFVAPAVTVKVEDAFGNVATNDSTTSVDVGITLCSTANVLESATDVAGIATFPSIRLNTVATGRVLDASATGLTADQSTSFDVTANTDRLFWNGFDEPLCTP